MGQPVLVHGVIPSQIQDSALAFAHFHEVPASPSSCLLGALQAAALPVSLSTVGIVFSLPKGIFHAFAHIINRYTKYY